VVDRAVTHHGLSTADIRLIDGTPRMRNRSYLTQLDAAIGDADHGANMNRRLQAVLAKMLMFETPISVRSSKGSR
jgi:dihydroxyacetone kinase